MPFYLQVNGDAGTQLAVVECPPGKAPDHPNQHGPFDRKPDTAGMFFNAKAGRLDAVPLTEDERFKRQWPHDKIAEALADPDQRAAMLAQAGKAAQSLREKRAAEG